MKFIFLTNFLFILFIPTLVFADFYDQHAFLNNKCCNYLSKTLDVEIFGTGGQMPDDVRGFTISTMKTGYATIPEARQMFVFGIESIKKIINSDPKIRPYLHNYPITMNEIFFSVNFQTTSGKYPPSKYLNGVWPIKNNQVAYGSYDHTEKKEVIIHVEPYEEALKIVQKANIMRNEP